MRLKIIDNSPCHSSLASPRLAPVALLLIVTLFSAAPLLGQASAGQRETQVNQPLDPANGAYRLGSGDVIRITVLKQDLLTQDGVRIGNDGNIRLPMLAEPIRAACLTEAELATVITERYQKYLLAPQVFVSTREFNSNSIAVIGAVNSPGRFQLQRPMRLLEILAFVNGLAATASDEVQILRTSPVDMCSESKPALVGQTPGNGLEPEIISLRIDDVLDGTAEGNPFLRGGDIVRVVHAQQKQAYVIGNVRAATSVNLNEPVTLSLALAMAGGPASGSKLDKIKITRQAPGSLSKTDIIVNLKEIRAGSRDDLLLEHNDVVDVPGPSATRKFFTNIIRSFVPIITGYPVIIP